MSWKQQSAEKWCYGASHCHSLARNLIGRVRFEVLFTVTLPSILIGFFGRVLFDVVVSSVQSALFIDNLLIRSDWGLSSIVNNCFLHKESSLT